MPDQRSSDHSSTVARNRHGTFEYIHGQHDGQQLLDESQHLGYLDRFGKTDAPRAVYDAAYRNMRALRREIEGLHMDEAERERRIDTLEREIDELERAQLKEGEEAGLIERRDLLRNSERYMSAVNGADYLLNGGEEQDGAVSQIQEAEQALADMRRFGDTFADLVRRLGEVRREVYDIAETVRDMKESFDFSPTELDEIEGRLDKLYRLKKKYGASETEMLAYLARARQELDDIQYADDTAVQLEKKLAAAEKETRAAAAKLTAARHQAAEELQSRILSELRELDMNKVRFEIVFAEKAPEKDGMDEVRFLLSANAGEELRPLHKIASGGELARIMLALKNVLAETDRVGTLVFDEVDTGVSGHAAIRVGEKMTQVSRKKQVLCVTHLPQIAALADVHFSVKKGESDGRTYTEVTCLDRGQRQLELARLSGGSEVTEALLQSTDEMLAAAQRYRDSLDAEKK